jgi:hypothetical protein
VKQGGSDHLAGARQRLDPRPQVVGDRDDAPGGGFRLAGPQLDMTAFQIDGGPIEPVQLLRVELMSYGFADLRSGDFG